MYKLIIWHKSTCDCRLVLFRILEGHLSGMNITSYPRSGTSSHPHTLPLTASHLDLGDSEAVMRCAEECVREGERERRRAESRAALVRQLHEAEAIETKADLKVCDVLCMAGLLFL